MNPFKPMPLLRNNMSRVHVPLDPTNECLVFNKKFFLQKVGNATLS